MAANLRICIRGAGVVGRTLALLLARERLRVALVAPAAAPAGHGRPRLRPQCRLARPARIAARWPDAAHATAVARHAGARRRRRRGQFRRRRARGDCAGLDRRRARARSAPGRRGALPAPHRTCSKHPCRRPSRWCAKAARARTRAEFGVEYDVTPYPQHAIATRLESANCRTARSRASGSSTRRDAGASAAGRRRRERCRRGVVGSCGAGCGACWR